MDMIKKIFLEMYKANFQKFVTHIRLFEKTGKKAVTGLD
jgi:hypothetical protein